MQQMDLPEERVDTDGNFEYRKILLLFEARFATRLLPPPFFAAHFVLYFCPSFSSIGL
jgi:hypothetical protein